MFKKLRPQWEVPQKMCYYTYVSSKIENPKIMNLIVFNNVLTTYSILFFVQLPDCAPADRLCDCGCHYCRSSSL